MEGVCEYHILVGYYIEDIIAGYYIQHVIASQATERLDLLSGKKRHWTYHQERSGHICSTPPRGRAGNIRPDSSPRASHKTAC